MTSASTTPQQYVQDKAAASGSSFYYAFLFMPQPRRAAISAFYAFCREVDDVVDEVSDPGVAAVKLQWWRKEVASAYAGTPTHPAMQALMPLAPTYGIEAGHLLAIINPGFCAKRSASGNSVNAASKVACARSA